MDIIMKCACYVHRGKVIYRGTREACTQNIKNRRSENASNMDKWTVQLPDGERLNVDEYMVRYAA
jgi:hypothetical protein